MSTVTAAVDVSELAEKWTVCDGAMCPGTTNELRRLLDARRAPVGSWGDGSGGGVEGVRMWYVVCDR